MSGKYLTIAEIAERWICSKDYVRKLIISGQLSGTKLGGWKVRQDELLRYEKSQGEAGHGGTAGAACRLHPRCMTAL